MKTSAVVFVALAAVLLYTDCVRALELCPKENCLVAEQCEEPVRNQQTACYTQGTSCCSIVKSEFRTHCRHFGGVCMDRCAKSLERDAVDCSNGQTCCILI